MSSFNEWPDAHFDARVARAPKTYPIETCNVSKAMFHPHPPIFHVPPCDPHPCPIHGLFPTCDVGTCISLLTCLHVTSSHNDNILKN